MKILHIYKVYFPESLGGVEQLIDSLATETTSPELSHTVLTTTQKTCIQRYRHGQVEVIAYPLTWNIASCPISLRLLKDFRHITTGFDLLHYHFPWPYADFLHLVLRIQKPFLVTYHSDVVRQKFLNIFYAPFREAFLKKAARIVATSQNYLASSPILEKYRDKVEIIPSGLPPLAQPPSEALLQSWEEKLGRDFFFFVGVLRQYKGLCYLVEAMASVKATLVIAGVGPEEPALRQQVTTLGLDNVVFVGKVDEENKAALCQLCKAMVVPSHLRSEAFCLTLVEGLRQGRPLISTEIGTGTSFVNQDQVTGLVVEAASPPALAKALQTLLDHPELCEKFGQAAKLRFQAYFTAEKMGQAYLDCISRLS